jgi:DegV family protein with EDD domain
MQAKDNVNFPVRVVDTRQVSWALGFPVLSGADARDAGADANGIVQAIQTAARSTMITFTVETLEYLHRGGRIGNASWLLGSALNIKPVLEVKGGVAEAAGKVRTRKRAIESLLDVAKDRAGGHPIQRVAVIHANVEQEGQELLGQAVKKFSPQESYLSNIAAVVGVHVGPGAIGVIVQWQA